MATASALPEPLPSGSWPAGSMCAVELPAPAPPSALWPAAPAQGSPLAGHAAAAQGAPGAVARPAPAPAGAAPEGAASPASASAAGLVGAELDGTPAEPWLAAPEVAARRARLGLEEAAAFVEACEFVSLGNFCGVGRALQALGLKGRAFPFDWVRSPLPGVLHCLETDFEDFLTFTTARTDEAHNLRIFEGARWGGSFWHHDPMDPKVKVDMVRRIERLMGLSADMPPSQPRVYVRAVNSTQELEDIAKLQEMLNSLIPGTPVYILIIVDFQLNVGPFRLDEGAWCDHLLFYRVHERAFQLPWSMERVADAYAEAIAFAARVWAAGSTAWSAIPAVKGLAQLMEILDQFSGGVAASESFWPRRLQGQQICLRGAKPKIPGLLVPAPPFQQPSVAAGIAQVRIPEGVQPGGFLDTDVFGMRLRFPVPEGASTGRLLQLERVADGIVSTFLVAATATATTAAATAGMVSGQGLDIRQVQAPAPLLQEKTGVAQEGAVRLVAA